MIQPTIVIYKAYMSSSGLFHIAIDIMKIELFIRAREFAGIFSPFASLIEVAINVIADNGNVKEAIFIKCDAELME